RRAPALIGRISRSGPRTRERCEQQIQTRRRLRGCTAMDLTIVAYTALAMSLLVSAVKMGGWILNADPAAIVNAGRWALAALPVAALALLLWLAASGRWTAAILLASFLLPVFVQAAPRWRVLFGSFNAVRERFRAAAPDLGVAPGAVARGRMAPDAELVER